MGSVKAIIFNIYNDSKEVFEYKDSDELFDVYFDNIKNFFSKSECKFDLNRKGYFIGQLSQFSYESGTFILIPNADYFGLQLSTSSLIKILKKKIERDNNIFLRDYSNNITNFLKEIDRDYKLSELGI
jgi:hypothetical protein